MINIVPRVRYASRSTAALLAVLLAVPGARAQQHGDFGAPSGASADTLKVVERSDAAHGVDAEVARWTAVVPPVVAAGAPAEDAWRLGQVLGAVPPGGFLLRSLAGAALAEGEGAPALALVHPELRMVWNSAIPFSTGGDGSMWAGRGANVRTRAGLRVRTGPLLVVLAPEVTASQNRAFDEVLPDTFPEMLEHFTLPWQRGRHSIDHPYRLGDQPLRRVDPGQSTLALVGRGVAAGASTEQHWWGPGVRNAIVLSDNAPGFPHLFVRTARPGCTVLGAVEAVWLVGGLSASEPYRARHGVEAGRRALSAAAVTLRPGGSEDFTLGIARAVYTPVDRWGQVPGRFGDVLWRRGTTGDTLAPPAEEQVTSLFGRWVIPAEGMELYAEWARSELPASFRDLLEAPEHGQGFTLGAAWARPVRAGAVRLSTEFTYLEQSSTYRVRPVPSFYASRAVPEGYTHRGRVLGAAIGPSGSSQHLAVDWYPGGGEVGVFAGRIRWNNDAFVDWQPTRRGRYHAHELSLYGGARAAARVAGYRVGMEWTVGSRWNYMLQNWMLPGWTTRDRSVDVSFQTLRFEVGPAGERR